MNLPAAPPVVVTVAHGDWIARETARRFGASVVLEKPIDIDGLRSLVGSIVRRRKA